MNNRCFNLKFFLLIIISVIGLIVSSGFLLFADKAGLVIGVLFFILCTAFIISLLIYEPIYYIIDENGLKICSCFKQNVYAWRDIISISLVYDILFDFLFIKDYVIHHKGNYKYVRRMERIFKCKKSTELIRRFYSKTII